MSRSLKLILAAILLAGALAAGLDRLREPSPSDEALRAFVNAQLKETRLKIVACTIGERSAARRELTAVATVDARRPAGTVYHPVHAPVGSARISRTHVAVDPATPFKLAEWRRVKELLTGPRGPRLLELANLDPEAASLTQLTVLRELALPETPLSFTLAIRATRRWFRWSLALEDTAAAQLAAVLPLADSPAAFPGETCVLGHAGAAARIDALTRRLPDIAAALDQAGARLMTEEAPAVRALLQPGTLFAGTIATSAPDDPIPPRVLLEITELRGDEHPPRFTAVARNDGGGDRHRVFDGRVEFAPATAGFLLVLTAPRGFDVDNDGPLLNDRHGGAELGIDRDGRALLRLAVHDTSLVSEERKVNLRLERVADDARDDARRALAGDRDALLAATDPARLYSGNITQRVSGRTEPFLLRFIPPPNGGEVVGAVLQHPDRPQWRCSLHGTLTLNRYRRVNGHALVLRPSFAGGVEPPEEMVRAFADPDGDQAIRLRFEHGRFLGDTQNFIYRFEPAPAARMAAHAERTAGRDAGLRAFVAPGAVHEGTVRRAGRDSPGRLLLRFLEPPASHTASDSSDPRPQTIRAVLCAADEPRFRVPLVGTLHVDDARLDVAFQSPPSWPGGGITQAPSLAPHLEDLWLYPAELSLVFEENEMAGTMERGGSQLDFRFHSSSSERTAQLRRDDAERTARLRAFVQPGALHVGTLGRHGARSPAPVRLRIAAFDERQRTVQGVLESATDPRFRSPVRGICDLDVGVVALTLREPAAWPLAAIDRDPALEPHLAGTPLQGDTLGLFVESDRLTGSTNALPDDRIDVAFAPASDELLRAEGKRDALWHAFFETNAAHDVRLRIDGEPAGELRLRIERRGAEPPAFFGTLESRARPSFASIVSGEIDPLHRVARLRLHGPARPGTQAIDADPTLPLDFRIAVSGGGIGLWLGESGVNGIATTMIGTSIAFDFAPAAAPADADARRRAD